MKRLGKITSSLTKWIGLIFIFPALLSVISWSLQDKPDSWHEADWSSSGLLASDKGQEAAVHVMAARTGGLKGALSIHSWIVVRKDGNIHYDRYDKVGWGNPVRKNAYPADGKWYSNTPQILATVRGDAAAAIIPKIEAAITDYPHRKRGGYRLWPGPNSNSFVAHVLREVPELDLVLPSNAVGRDFISGNKLFHLAEDGLDAKISVAGLFGVTAGVRSGLEVNVFGLVAGVDVVRPALKLPGFGRLGMPRQDG